MAPNALLKFQQGASIGNDGEAFIAPDPTAIVDIANATSGGGSDIGSWRIEVVFAPPGSTFQISNGIVPGTPYVLAENTNDDTPAGSITPELAFRGHCFRIVLTLWENSGFSGTQSIDIRDFTTHLPAPDGSGKSVVFPPWQDEPKPLLRTGSGGRPNEMNFQNQPWGWSGKDNSGSHYLNTALLRFLVENTQRNTAQANWYVDPSNSSGNASDLNDGATSGTPLLTWAELVRRWGPDPVFTTSVTIHLLSDMPNEQIKIRATVRNSGGASITVKGEGGATVGTETLNSATNLSPPATPYALTSAAVANWGASGYTAKQIIWNGGNTTSWIAGIDPSDPSIAWAGTPCALNLPLAQVVTSGYGGTEVLTIRELARTSGFDLDVRGDSPQFGGITFSPLIIRDIKFQANGSNAPNYIRSGGGPSNFFTGEQGACALFYGCSFVGSTPHIYAQGGAARFGGCLFSASPLFFGGRFLFMGCVSGLARMLFVGSHVEVMSNFIGYGNDLGSTPLLVVEDSSHLRVSGNTAFFGGGPNIGAVQVGPDSDARINSPLFGTQTAAGSFGLDVKGRAWAVSLSNLIVDGASGEARIGGAMTPYAALPIINPANNAMIVVEP